MSTRARAGLLLKQPSVSPSNTLKNQDSHIQLRFMSDSSLFD
jgi:hypothetical protein